MKGLEALERIKNAPTIYVGCASDIYTRYSFECKEIEKALKALEIIKHIVKIVDYSDHTIVNGNLIILQGGEIKTKEEYDLLKEVLE